MTKYDPVMKRVQATEKRSEITFRIGGDEFLQVVYGSSKMSAEKTLKEIILNALRVVIINNKVKKANIKGVLETVPGVEGLLYKFDPFVTNHKELAENIYDLEESLPDIEDSVIQTRKVRMPITFDDALVAESINKYVRDVKPESVNCKDGSNLEYIAKWNGITVQEVKDKFMKTDWLVAMLGFFPGLPYYFPLNPTCAITAPKYNPARTTTPEGGVDLADYCSTIFGVESSGGYQMIGRTVPIFQVSGVHSQYNDNPALFKPTDIIEFYESTEEEINNIHKMVHEEGKWEYDITGYEFVLKDWLELYDSKSEETVEFRKKQAQGSKVTPLP